MSMRARGARSWVVARFQRAALSAEPRHVENVPPPEVGEIAQFHKPRAQERDIVAATAAIAIIFLEATWREPVDLLLEARVS
jgi:hypothetical protein